MHMMSDIDQSFLINRAINFEFRRFLFCRRSFGMAQNNFRFYDLFDWVYSYNWNRRIYTVFYKSLCGTNTFYTVINSFYYLLLTVNRVTFTTLGAYYNLHKIYYTVGKFIGTFFFFIYGKIISIGVLLLYYCYDVDKSIRFYHNSFGIDNDMTHTRKSYIIFYSHCVHVIPMKWL